MTEAKPAKLAILIDAENVLPTHAEMIFSSATDMGDVVAKEIYGVAAALGSWVEPVLKYAIHPNLTIKASKGKNTSDIALVIGAMDLLLKGEADTVVIASSDSDFSMLSVRLRTAGINVIGMGTEKSNPLWRTACSSFVVLDHPATPAQPSAQSRSRQAQSRQNPQRPPQPQQPQRQQPQQPQPQRQQQQQPQRQQSPAQPVSAAPAAQPHGEPPAATHRDRAAVIQQTILKRLASNGGRVQVSTLFSALNRLPEYRADRQEVGKKPLNYLTSTFADVFDFETSADGKIWISVRSRAASIETPVDERKPVEVIEAEPVPDQDNAFVPDQAEATETLPEAIGVEAAEAPEPETEVAPEAEAAPEETADEEAPEALPEAEEVPAEAPENIEAAAEPAVEAAEAPTPEPQQDEVVSGFIDRMVEDGIERPVAENIARILSETDNLRTAYNALRKAYGNAGRDYYNRAKEILTGAQ